MIKILICNKQIIESMERGNNYDFSDFEPIFINPSPEQQVDHDKLLQIFSENPDIKGVIIGDETFNKEIIDNAPNLKLISKWGQGMDNIDILYANSKNVQVKNCPGLLAKSVADISIGYLLSLTRDIHNTHYSVKNSEWPKLPGIELDNKIAAVIGLGNIGREIIIRLKSFGVTIIGYDPFLPDKDFLSKYQVITENSEEKAILKANFIFICCNLTENNFKFFNKSIIEKLSSVFVINVGRGNLIDEDALIIGLKNNNISAIAMDVYNEEPLPINSPLRKLNNVLFGTHSAGQSFEAIERVNLMAIENLDILK